MFFPGAHLQDEVVGIGAGDKILSKSVEHLLECSARCGISLPQFFSPPFLGVEPGCPDGAEGFQSFGRGSRIVAVAKAGVGGDRGDLSFQSHETVRPGSGRARGGHDAVDKIRITDCPLKSLLGAHGKTDKGF